MFMVMFSMTSVVALGAITGGTNLTTCEAELSALGLIPGSFTVLSGEQMEDIRRALEAARGTLPLPRVGGSVANTADFIARAGISCGLMGIGGDCAFGRAYVKNCERASLEFLLRLEDGAFTGYDFYLDSADGKRTIIWTSGANTLLSPSRINLQAIREAELVLFDGGPLDLGPESEAAVTCCARAAIEANVPFVLTLASTGIVEDYRDFFEHFAPRAQLVAGNLEQAAVLVSLDANSSLRDMSRELAKTSIDAVVTLDADGAFARIGGEEFLQPTRKIDATDSTGAGDNFLAAFLLARMKGLSVPKALATGNVVSSKVIQIEAARLPLGYDIPGLLKEAMETADSLPAKS